jgi:hypothetical protein
MKDKRREGARPVAGASGSGRQHFDKVDGENSERSLGDQVSLKRGATLIS